MTEPEFRAECTAPGRQAVLFHEPSGAAPSYRVVDRDGMTQARTRALGIAVTVAAHLVAEHGEAWICATDGSTVRVDPAGVSSDTPTRPWVRSVASTIRTKEQP